MQKEYTFCGEILGFPGGSDRKNMPARWETRVQSLGQEDPLEEGMTTHCTILAWRIPWTEDRGGLQPMGSQSVWHYWETNGTFYGLSDETHVKWKNKVKSRTSLLPSSPSQPPPRCASFLPVLQNSSWNCFWIMYTRTEEDQAGGTALPANPLSPAGLWMPSRCWLTAGASFGALSPACRQCDCIFCIVAIATFNSRCLLTSH